MEKTTIYAGPATGDGGRHTFSVAAFPTQGEHSVEFQLNGFDEENKSLFKAKFIGTDAQMLQVSAWTHQAEGRIAVCIALQFGASVLGEIYRVWADSLKANAGLTGSARWKDVIDRLRQAGGNLAAAAAQAIITCTIPGAGP